MFVKDQFILLHQYTDKIGLQLRCSSTDAKQVFGSSTSTLQ